MYIVLNKKFEVLSLNVQHNYDKVCVNINQSLDSINTIKSYSKELDIINNTQNTLESIFYSNKKLSTLHILLNNLSNIVVVISLSIIYGLGSIYVMNNNLTLGTVMGLGVYFQSLVQPIYELLNYISKFHESIPIFDRLYEYFNMENEDLNFNNNKFFFDSICIKNLYFSYNKNLTLKNININILGSGLYAFVGSSGSGKSTLIKLLMKFYYPTKGNIYLSNINSKNLQTSCLRNSISLVSQDLDIFNISIKENIKYGNSNVKDNEIINICKKLNIHDKITKLPQSYDTIINERVNFSGGEKQRICIARALLKNASIYIFDEPTSALDSNNEDIIKNIIEELSMHYIVIVVSHKISTIINANNIFVFENGTIVENGNHFSLINKNGVYFNKIYKGKNNLIRFCENGD